MDRSSDRSSNRASRTCLVCDLADRRALVDVGLDDGSSVTLCGTHAVILRRTTVRVGSASELASLLRDRRAERTDRRNDEIDDLAMALRVGFSGDRRRGTDRRAGLLERRRRMARAR